MARERNEWEGILRDLKAHLRWRLEAGLPRLGPPPEPEAPGAEQAPPSESEEIVPGATPNPKRVPSGPKGYEKGLGSPELEAIRQVLDDCGRCKLCETRTNLVFGVGNPHAELVFVGEGPGRDEDLQGEPFVGRAGELLTRMIQAMGYARDEVYICNVVKCRPPGNRDPEPDEVAACEPFLKAQLAAIHPKVVVALGRFAVQCLLGDPHARITRVRGTWHRYEGIPLMPTFHPAYLLRNPKEKRKAWEDLKAVMARLGREVPPGRQT